MSSVDWSIVVVLVVFLFAMAFYARHYNRSVADFLAANRTAGRYLICVADGMAGLGAISLIAMFELHYRAGFPPAWYDILRLTIIPTLLGLSGWIIYRFRETRALTLGQFFEMRYSRRFRIVASIIVWLAGIINFAIFPAVGGRFFLYYLGIADTMLNMAICMALLIGLALFFTYMGGQIVVIISDFAQGIFCNVVFLAVLAVFFYRFRWNSITEAMTHHGANASMINPFKVSDVQDFNLTFYLMSAFGVAYSFMLWQGQQGYNSCALNPHEAKIGRSLGTSWRMIVPSLFWLFIPVCIYTFLHHPAFAEQAAPAVARLDNVGRECSETIHQQVTVHVALRQVLGTFPRGFVGAFAAVMLAAFISTHDTYLHSWGSIFIQDIVLPWRKKPLPARQHLRLLRLSILGIAVFIFIFSLLFQQTDYIVMYFAITGGIIFGTGACLIGGLYWSKGTTPAAWAALLAGAFMATIPMILQQIDAHSPLQGNLFRFIIAQNGMVVQFWAAIVSIIVYVLVSLGTVRPATDLNRLLHRSTTASQSTPQRKTFALKFSAEFTTWDKVIYLASAGWIGLLVAVFLTVTIWNFVSPIDDAFWVSFWKYYAWTFFVTGAVVTGWFLFGGIRDIRMMLARLRSIVRDEHDDGSV